MSHWPRDESKDEWTINIGEGGYHDFNYWTRPHDEPLWHWRAPHNRTLSACGRWNAGMGATKYPDRKDLDWSISGWDVARDGFPLGEICPQCREYVSRSFVVLCAFTAREKD